MPSISSTSHRRRRDPAGSQVSRAAEHAAATRRCRMRAACLPRSPVRARPRPGRRGLGPPRTRCANSLDLARHAEPLGYHALLGRRAPQHAGHRELGAGGADRATSRPATERIRVGSGGVMLPNHAPLVVAEQFGTLEALHPGPHRPRPRPRARHRPAHGARAAPQRRRRRRRRLPRPARSSCIGVLRRPRPSDIRTRDRRRPGRGNAGRLAARLERLQRPAGRLRSGCRSRSPTTSAPHNTLPALALYRERVPAVRRARRSRTRWSARAVLCADTDERGRSAGRVIGRLVDPAACDAAGRPDCPRPRRPPHTRSPTQERAVVDERTAGHVVGGPDTVRAGVDELLAATAADELMVSTIGRTTTPTGAGRSSSWPACTRDDRCEVRPSGPVIGS